MLQEGRHYTERGPIYTLLSLTVPRVAAAARIPLDPLLLRLIAKLALLPRARLQDLQNIQNMQNILNMNYGNLIYNKKQYFLVFRCFKTFRTVQIHFGIVGVFCTINCHF